MNGHSMQSLAARARLLLCLDLLAPQAASDVEDTAQAPFIHGCRRLLSHARASGWRVAHVHVGAAAGPAARPVVGAAPLPSEPVMRRSGVSAFSSPEFRRLMRANPQAELVVIGASVDATCLATALAAFDRGLAVTIVSDAVSVSPQERLGLDGLEHLVQSMATPRLRLVSADTVIGAPKLSVIEGGAARAINSR